MTAKSGLEPIQELLRVGNRQEARHLAVQAIRGAPRDKRAWALYLRCLNTDAERIQALTYLARIFPADAKVQETLARLRGRQERPGLPEHTAPALPAAKPATTPLAPAEPDYRRRYRALRTFLLAGLVAVLATGALLAARLGPRQAELRQLQLEHRQLQLDYARLQSGQSALNQEHQALRRSYDDMVDTYEELRVRYQGLAIRHEQMLQVAVMPPYVCTTGRQASIGFVGTDGISAVWSIPFESLEQSLRRTAPYNTLHLNTAAGEEITVRDFRPFVDPEPFRDLVTPLYYATGGGEAFIRAVWRIATQVTEYVHEDGEVPRYPLETLLGGGGDCEDTAILVASMLAAAPVDWEVDLVYVDSDSLGDPEKSNHVIVYVSTGAGDYYIETTNDTQMQASWGEITGWKFAVAP